MAARALCGQLIKLYIISYLVYRFFSEFIRPEPEIWLGLTAYQWTAVALLPVFAALWIRDARRQTASELKAEACAETLATND